MNVWAIADLHLCISCREKTMEDFGERWSHYLERIEAHWVQNIKENDLVLIPGDITWALKSFEAEVDLKWLARLPGIKVMIRGNHDYWWRTKTQVQKILPPNFYAIHNDALKIGDIALAGSRLWDTSEYNFQKIVELKENPKKNPKSVPLSFEENEKIFEKELKRLEISLQKMDHSAKYKIVLTHYPPISWDLKPSKTHQLLKRFQINFCVFGHLHNVVNPPSPFFGAKDGIQYHFCAADYLQFKPLKIKLD